MAREIAISTYLLFFQIFFNFFKLFPQKEKTVCVASFGDNIFYTARSLRMISNQEIIILKDRACKYPFDSTISRIVPFDITHPFAYLQSIYHLATASTVLVDNYFGFLAITKFKENTTCIQLWHAVGAIKKFGLKDPTIKSRHQIAKDRFRKVYNRFDYTVVGSENMATVFRESFGILDNTILRTGIPRTDIFYDEPRKKQIQQKLIDLFPAINGKKVILYAPTFREHQLSNYKLAFDLEQLYKELSNEYVIFIKQHPSVSFTLKEGYNNFVYDVSDYFDTNHLFLVTDILVTDYSSVSFEYSLLEKQLIFFAYDMPAYKQTSGLISNYESKMPGPVISTTEALIIAIKETKFDTNKLNNFAAQWNEYSDGNSSMRLATFLTEKDANR